MCDNPLHALGHLAGTSAFVFAVPARWTRVQLQIDRGERLCLLGRNGEGKSTLLRLIQGDLEPDEGQVVRQQGLVTTMLIQEVPRDLPGTVFEAVSAVRGPQGRPLADYEVERVLSRMGLQPDVQLAVLSAGMKRRVLLARALAAEPDVLLLDEPTNHLNLNAITWLEEFLLRFAGTLLMVTHDRVFLRKLATRIIELDRGLLTSWSCGYDTFLARKQAALEAEAVQRALFNKRLAQEEVWIRRKIEARRNPQPGPRPLAVGHAGGPPPAPRPAGGRQGAAPGGRAVGPAGDRSQGRRAATSATVRSSTTSPRW